MKQKKPIGHSANVHVAFLLRALFIASRIFISFLIRELNNIQKIKIKLIKFFSSLFNLNWFLYLLFFNWLANSYDPKDEFGLYFLFTVADYSFLSFTFRAMKQFSREGMRFISVLFGHKKFSLLKLTKMNWSEFTEPSKTSECTKSPWKIVNLATKRK